MKPNPILHGVIQDVLVYYTNDVIRVLKKKFKEYTLSTKFFNGKIVWKDKEVPFFRLGNVELRPRYDGRNLVYSYSTSFWNIERAKRFCHVNTKLYYPRKYDVLWVIEKENKAGRKIYLHIIHEVKTGKVEVDDLRNIFETSKTNSCLGMRKIIVWLNEKYCIKGYRWLEGTSVVRGSYLTLPIQWIAPLIRKRLGEVRKEVENYFQKDVS